MSNILCNVHNSPWLGSSEPQHQWHVCAADANILINKCRLAAQQYEYAYQEPIPVEQLVRSLCDNKQGYTQFGGLRPFGVSLLYGGWCVPQLFCFSLQCCSISRALLVEV